MALSLGFLIFSFIVTGIILIPFINLLYKLKFTRRVEAPKFIKKSKIPLFDKMHDWKAGTPVGGGILIIIVVSLLFFLLFPLVTYLGVQVTKAYPLGDEVRIIFLAFIGFGLLGLYDDLVKFFGKPKAGETGQLFGLSKYSKFLIQWILASVIAFMLWNNLKIDILNLPIADKLLHLDWLYIPFAAFVIVAFTNAVNITDGLDGLAGGALVICLFAFWIIAANFLDTPLTIFIALWIGALIAFLYFNIWPARIFMGDVGALSFGATLAVIGLLVGKIFALVIIGGIFIVEVATSFLQLSSKKLFGKKIFPIAPFHLMLQSIGWEEPKIVMRVWLAGIMLAIFGLWSALI
ncbi:phospho-N-acetylmuramoyl-pentapeptide-transferase [Candidatus Microgenomates bacterium]|nr:phospho-N-acetylmuramoyl-pentapeptide-transferase [Candidatus Microgenomates bacterium]